MTLRDLAVEWRQLFGGSEFLKPLRERALKRGLRGSHLRSVAWRVFLEVLPPYISTAEWPQRIAQLRSDYDALCAKHFVDPKEEMKKQDEVIDPLSQSADSPWNKFFQNNELQKEIMRDIERTYPEHEFFQEQQHQDALKRVLFVYAKEHPDVQYRQGMHELLAPLYFLIHSECSNAASATGPAPVPGSDEAVLRALLDPSRVEHDSWATFAALMVHANDFFAGYSNAQGSKQTRSGSSSTTPSPPLGQQAALARPGSASPPAEQQETPIVKRCKRVQNVLLRQKDPQLCDRLEALDIQPQLYCLRWLRLMFGREFHIQDLMTLWDGIFAYGRSLALVDGIAVSMLIYVREQLFTMDNMNAMRRLLKYPPVEDVSLLVAKALELVTPRPSTAGPISPTQNPLAAPSLAAPHTPAVASADHYQHKFADNLRSILIGENEPRIRQLEAIRQQQQDELDVLRREVTRFQESHAHCAARVERIVFSLQQEISSKAELAASETLVHSLAELKQVQAVLSGMLPEPIPE
eukprot:m51a1_g7432 hypothetical protein (523) ;mRNA; f:44502-46839